MARSMHDKPGASYRASKKLLKIKQTEETNKKQQKNKMVGRNQRDTGRK